MEQFILNQWILIDVWGKTTPVMIWHDPTQSIALTSSIIESSSNKFVSGHDEIAHHADMYIYIYTYEYMSYYINTYILYVYIEI